MTRKQMFVSVFQALTLDALAIIANYYAWLYIVDKVQDYEFFAPPDFYNSTVLEASVTRNNGTGNVTSYDNSTVIMYNVSHAATTDNATTMHTVGTMLGQLDDGESFWLKTFPKQMAPLVLLLPLNYYWMLWLERMLPGRRRWSVAEPFKSPSAAASTSKEKPFLEDDAAEEEVINAWIAKGKVHRSSLSWWNTFLKWMLDLSIGNIWRALVGLAIEKTIVDRWTLSKMRELFWMEYLSNLFVNLFCVNSLGNLVSFVLVPASKRIVFLSFSNLVWVIFFQAGMSQLLPWIMKRHWIQEAIHTANEANRNDSLAEAAKGMAPEGERPEL